MHLIKAARKRTTPTRGALVTYTRGIGRERVRSWLDTRRLERPQRANAEAAPHTAQALRRTIHGSLHDAHTKSRNPLNPCAGARARCLGSTPRGELWWALLAERGRQTRGEAPACSARRGYRSRNPCRRPAEGGAEGAARFGCGGDAASSTAGAVSPSSGSAERRRLPGEAGDASTGMSRNASVAIMARQSRVAKSTTCRTRRRTRARICLWRTAERAALRCCFALGCRGVCVPISRREGCFCCGCTVR